MSTSPGPSDRGEHVAAKPQRLARLQAWLQGCYPHAPHRPWFMWRLGNLISDLRYRAWRLQGGKYYGE